MVDLVMSDLAMVDLVMSDHEVVGYIFTQWDCPVCGFVNEVESDISNENSTCEDCGTHVLITECR